MAAAAVMGRRGLTIGVGLVAPTAGPFAKIGDDIQKGFRLYLDNNQLTNLTLPAGLTNLTMKVEPNWIRSPS